MMFKHFHLNVIARISIGLVSLVVSLILISDFVFNIFPKRDAIDSKVRMQMAKNLATQFASLVEADASATIHKTIHGIIANQPEVKSIGIRKSDGWLAYASHHHSEHWALKPQTASTEQYLHIPIYNHNNQWGQVEISFDALQTNFSSKALNKQLISFVCIGLLAVILIYLYLSRALQYLRPSKAVPNRVHSAFDIITDSILVLDQDGKIVLANMSFKQLQQAPEEAFYGKKINEINLMQDLIKQLDMGDHAWKTTFSDMLFRATTPDKQRFMLLASCAPVNDDNNQSRGYLITLKNITELHETNQKLSETLQELKLSRAKLELNNEQLQEMAFRDSLTGCLNRRAFFQKAEDLYTLALQGNRELYCVMADIDFFKSFNDIYGHYVGDQVIQIVARILTSKLRPSDIVCRYGGEEFCILITDVTKEQALDICERMRSSIEENGNQSLRNQDVKQITASFGIASINAGTKSLENLIDYADSALYISKESGRNQVNQWLSSMRE